MATVAALLRFRLACKSWLSHIDSPNFISQHTRRISSSSDNNKLVIMHDVFDPHSLSFSFLSPEDLHLSNYVKFSQTAHEDDDLGYNRILVSSVHGVICLKNAKVVEDVVVDIVSLWNPATKQLAVLPPPLQSDIKENHGYCIIEYGFGFDAKTNDYKVVRFVVLRDPHDHTFLKSQVVYSLRMDSWRIIDVTMPPKFYSTSNPRRPYMDETYLWLGRDLIARCCSILSFNFSNDKFGIIQLPEPKVNSFESVPILTFLEEKISYIDWGVDGSDYQSRHFKIWVLDQYCAKESWTKLYTVSLDLVDIPLGFSRDGKLIFVKVEDRRNFCLYDPVTQEFKDILSLEMISEVAIYKESLISVKSANGVTKRVAYEVVPLEI